MWFALTQPLYGTSMPQSGRRPQHQKLRFDDVRVASALPPEADIHRKGRHVSNVPIAATALFTAAGNSCTLLESCRGHLSKSPALIGQQWSQWRARNSSVP